MIIPAIQIAAKAVVVEPLFVGNVINPSANARSFVHMGNAMQYNQLTLVTMNVTSLSC